MTDTVTPPSGPTPAPQARFPDLAGKVAIVTGTSRGIGCGIAEVLAGQGMKLVLAARSAEKGQAFADGLRDGGADCLFVPADLATPEGAQRVYDAAVERFPRVHLLVNNAAHLASKSILELDEQEYRASFEGNMRMIYGLSHLLARHMAAAGGGNIVHISSVGGLRAHRGLAGYDASKGAIDALTRSMALDLAGHNVRVNTVAPGAIARSAIPADRMDKHRQRCGMVPLLRTGTPHEIGWSVAFLASDVAAYVTGQVLYVDGGLVAQLVPPGQWV
jgi:3-oxoacyl-[acyl-carrier protein] reductase